MESWQVEWDADGQEQFRPLPPPMFVTVTGTTDEIVGRVVSVNGATFQVASVRSLRHMPGRAGRQLVELVAVYRLADVELEDLVDGDVHVRGHVDLRPGLVAVLVVAAIVTVWALTLVS